MSDSIEKIYCYGDRCNDYGMNGWMNNQKMVNNIKPNMIILQLS